MTTTRHQQDIEALKLEVFCSTISPNSRAVMILIKCTGITVTINEIKKKPLSRNYSCDMNQMIDNQDYPVIIDHENNLHLMGSSAIMRYLCAKYKLHDCWYPNDLVSRAKVDEYIAWHDSNTRIAAANVYKLKVIDPSRMHIPVNEEQLRRAKSLLDQVLHRLVTEFLKDKDYLCSNEISIADILAICELAQAVASGFAIGDGRPHLHAWVERVKNRLNPHFEKVHGLMEMKKPFRWLSIDSAT